MLTPEVPATWQEFHGETFQGRVEGGEIILPANHSVVSAPSYAAEAGDIFRASGFARIATAASQDENRHFYFGPIFYDSRMAIIQYWSLQEQLTAVGRDVVVEAIAPAGAYAVRAPHPGISLTRA